MTFFNLDRGRLAGHTLVLVAAMTVFLASARGQTSMNVTLFGTLNPLPVRYSGCWGWAATDGSEYALLGGFEGLHVISIDDSMDIHQVDFVDGSNSNWREITVIGNHAFVVTEGGGDLQGLQVIDLSPLPDSVHLVTTYIATFFRAHIISHDETNNLPYVYVSGTSSTGGVHIIDVSDPANPQQVGLYDPTYYIHDAFVTEDLMFASALGVGLDIVDISDRSAPSLIGQIDHPGQFTHSSWTTEDRSHIVIADETDGLPARIWNIEDLGDPFEVAQYSANLQSLVHNPYVLGDLLFVSHNTEGMRVVDIRDPALPLEVGYYDTYSGTSGGFNGLWSAYPFFPSGKIIGGNREDGLYVWRFNGTRAGRIYGVVVDSLSGELLSGAAITINEAAYSTVSDSSGIFALVALPSGPGGYTIEVELPGYVSRTFSGFILSGGDSLSLQVPLVPTGTSVEPSDGDLPLAISLLQNYPNPFNPSTEIRYTIGEATRVRLQIYDVLGELVRDLVDEPQSAGVWSKSWDGLDNRGKRIGSGMYFYRLEAGGQIMMKRMVMLR